MRTFIKEFKTFVSRGNVLDMAVGVIIGGAFSSIVKSLVDDIINPLLGLFGGMNFDQLVLHLGSNVTLYYGKFITAVINFLIMSLLVFLIVKMMNQITVRLKTIEEKPKVENKVCPFCKSEIHVEATKCPHCTADVA